MADVKLNQKNIRFLKYQASSIYLPFFETLLKPKKADPKRSEMLLQVLKDIDRLIALTTKILDKGVTIATAKDAQTINMLVTSIEQQKEVILGYIIESELTQARKSVEVDSEDISLATEILSDEKAQQEQQVSQGTPPSRTGGPITEKSIERAFSRSAWKSAAKGYGVQQLWRLKRKADSAIAPMLGPYGALTSLGLPLGAGALGLGYLGYKGARGIARSLSWSTPRSSGTLPEPGITSPLSSGFSGTSSSGTDLMWFFETGWKKATWTKDIYDSIVDGGGKPSGMGGSLTKMLVTAAGALGLAWFLKLSPEERQQKIQQAMEALEATIDTVTRVVERTINFIETHAEDIKSLVNNVNMVAGRAVKTIDHISSTVTTVWGAIEEARSKPPKPIPGKPKKPLITPEAEGTIVPKDFDFSKIHKDVMEGNLSVHDLSPGAKLQYQKKLSERRRQLYKEVRILNTNPRSMDKFISLGDPRQIEATDRRNIQKRKDEINRIKEIIRALHSEGKSVPEIMDEAYKRRMGTTLPHLLEKLNKNIDKNNQKLENPMPVPRMPELDRYTDPYRTYNIIKGTKK